MLQSHLQFYALAFLAPAVTAALVSPRKRLSFSNGANVEGFQHAKDVQTCDSESKILKDDDD